MRINCEMIWLDNKSTKVFWCFGDEEVNEEKKGEEKKEYLLGATSGCVSLELEEHKIVFHLIQLTEELLLFFRHK